MTGIFVGEKSLGSTELVGLGPYVLETWWDSTILIREGGWGVGLIDVKKLLAQAVPLLVTDLRQMNIGTGVGEKSSKSTQKANQAWVPSSPPAMMSYFFTCKKKNGCLRESVVTPTSNLVWEPSAHLLTAGMMAVLGSTSVSGRDNRCLRVCHSCELIEF